MSAVIFSRISTLFVTEYILNVIIAQKKSRSLIFIPVMFLIKLGDFEQKLQTDFSVMNISSRTPFVQIGPHM